MPPPKENKTVQGVPLLDLKAQYQTLREEIRAAVDRVMDSQNFILGPEVEALEKEIADYSKCSFAVGVSSGTDALLACLMAIDLKPGEEVITTPYTFFATAGAIARLGGIPKFVDIDPKTYLIRPDRIEAAITPKTRAIIPVHLYGQMAEMDPIMETAKKHGLTVIEDAAQAIGAERAGKRAGSVGHFGCFSFFPSKNLGAFGDGGMITAQDAQLADRLTLLRNHGYRPKYYNKIVGGNFRLDAIQAAVLRVKLKYLDAWTQARQKNAALYRKLLEGVKEIVLPVEIPGGRNIYNQFVIRAGNRDKLLSFLKENQIGSEVYYPVPLHLQECFKSLGYKAGNFPESESAAAGTLALPVYPELAEHQVEYVAAVIRKFYV